MALTDKLTAIADAIRGKTGGADALTLDAMAAAIEALETGGGSARIATGTYTPAEDITIANNEGFAIEHNAGFIPRAFIFYRTKGLAAIENEFKLSCAIINKPPLTSTGGIAPDAVCSVVSSSTSKYTYPMGAYLHAGVLATKTASIDTWNVSKAVVVAPGNSSSYTGILAAATTYNWIAISDWEGNF